MRANFGLCAGIAALLAHTVMDEPTKPYGYMVEVIRLILFEIFNVVFVNYHLV